jgi:hypothetical protein
MGRGTVSRYCKSFFIENEYTPNNLTIDDQRAGGARTFRHAVSDGISNRKVVELGEDAFRKTHTMFLDCILRQSRTVGQDDYKWDVTSKMVGVAHGRQLQADPLFQLRNVGIGTETGRQMFFVAKRMFGEAAKYLLPNVTFMPKMELATAPAAKLLKSAKITYVMARYRDGTRQGDRFKRTSDVSDLKPLEDWD